MKTAALLACLCLCLFAMPARTQTTPEGAVWNALEDELSRTAARLAMEGFPRPYYVSYTVQDVSRRELAAALGNIRHDLSVRQRNFKVDLRVGSSDFDNSHFIPEGYWNVGPVSGPLPVEDDYAALRQELWLATDAAYTSALEQISRKLAYKQARMIQDVLPDLSPAPVRVSIKAADRKPSPSEAWKRRLEKLSATFKDYPEIQDAQIALYWTETLSRFADNEGRRIAQPADDYELYAVAGGQADDGMRLVSHRRLIHKSPDHIPPFSLLEAEIQRLAEELKSLTKARPIKEDYIGPVLLEGQAAGEFFAQTLAHAISYPRELWIESEDPGPEFQPGGLTGRMGTRVLSSFLDVEDDPSLSDFEGVPLIGGCEFDDEGVASLRTLIAEAGILKGLPASRSPSKHTPASNGHGRGPLWQRPQARISNLIITARETESLPEMKRRLLGRAKEFGLDHAYIARRLLTSEMRKRGESLSAPVLLYRLDAGTGEETLVRDAEFSNVSLRSLRDIVSAGDRRHVYNHYQIHPAGQGQTQASIVHPSVLISELELKRTSRKPDARPKLKHPYFD